MNQKETEVYIRRSIKDRGIVFKPDYSMRINNQRTYVFTDRDTRKIIMGNVTLGNALNNVCSGFFDNYDTITGNLNNDNNQ